MAKSRGKVTIKKYANRRLYDTESSTYITLDRLAQMVREGREFEVVDAKTGEDITRQVLTQIIVDEEARGGATMLPINFLKQLIGLYGNSMQNFVPQYLEAAMDAFQRNQSAVSDAFGGNMFADLAKRNMAMFEDAAQAFTGKRKPADKPSSSDMDQLQGRARRAAGQSRQAEPLTTHAICDCCGARAARSARRSPRNRRRPRSEHRDIAARRQLDLCATAGRNRSEFHRMRSASPARAESCTRATRRVTISRPAAAAAPFVSVWTSSKTRSVPATFNPATGRLTRSWLPTIRCSMRSRSSRGRIAFGVPGAPPLVRAAVGGDARVIEDCRV